MALWCMKLGHGRACWIPSWEDIRYPPYKAQGTFEVDDFLNFPFGGSHVIVPWRVHLCIDRVVPLNLPRKHNSPSSWFLVGYNFPVTTSGGICRVFPEPKKRPPFFRTIFGEVFTPFGLGSCPAKPEIGGTELSMSNLLGVIKGW